MFCSILGGEKLTHIHFTQQNRSLLHLTFGADTCCEVSKTVKISKKYKKSSFWGTFLQFCKKINQIMEKWPILLQFGTSCRGLFSPGITCLWKHAHLLVFESFCSLGDYNFSGNFTFPQKLQHGYVAIS